MLTGQKSTIILQEERNAIVRLCEDVITCTCSIGLRTTKGVEWKYISQELHDLLVKELATQEGNH